VKYSHAKLFFPLHTESEPFPMRVLFLNQPTVGHANTLLNIALQMRSEQHTVSFLMPGFRHTGSRFKFLKAATRVPEIVAAHGIPVDLIRPPVRVLLQALRLPHSQGYAEIKLALELFSRGAYYYTRHVWAEVERLRPDVMVADFAFFPPHLVGELLNIPCVVVYHSGLPFRGKMVPPFGSGLPIEEQTPAWGEYVQQEQKLLERLDRRINTARAKIGLSPMPTGTLHTPYSRWLNLVTSVEAIEAPRDNLGRNTLFIGPCFAQRQTLENDFPFKRLRADRYKVYVSLGTVFNNKPDVFRKITSALDNPEFQVIVSAGGAYEKLSQSHLPENVLLFERVPQIALLPKVDLVIGHGGNNSTNETLAAGKPLIILPVGGEQGDNASRVEYLDVGLRVDIQQFDATEIYHKVQTIRTTPGFQARAHALQQAIAKTDGPFSASTCIQWVARHRQPMLRPQGFPLTVTRENLPELIGCQPVQKTQFTRDRIPQ
jgi:MGT family glycosyltransferase